jgi:hypothetical protein
MFTSVTIGGSTLELSCVQERPKSDHSPLNRLGASGTYVCECVLCLCVCVCETSSMQTARSARV